MEEKSPPPEERVKARMEADETGAKARAEAPEPRVEPTKPWMKSAKPGSKAPDASVEASKR